MTALISIGDFSRMTHLTVKTLRHYHEIGLLEPATVEPTSGYRLYHADQVSTAQVIRRLRQLEMPLDDVRQVLAAEDLAARNAVIVGHLERMEEQLAATQETVATLKTLLAGPGPRLGVAYRTAPSFRAVVAQAEVALDGPADWFGSLFARLHGAITDADRAGADGVLYQPDYFQADRGRVTAFVPIRGAVLATDDVSVGAFAAVDFAVAVHTGGFESIDRTYGALGTYVAERAIGVDGPIRENYISADFSRIEVCWPIFRADPATDDDEPDVTDPSG